MTGTVKQVNLIALGRIFEHPLRPDLPTSTFFFCPIPEHSVTTHFLIQGMSVRPPGSSSLRPLFDNCIPSYLRPNSTKQPVHSQNHFIDPTTSWTRPLHRPISLYIIDIQGLHLSRSPKINKIVEFHATGVRVYRV